jgi:CRP-like cAMP-binding protein
VVTVSVVAQVVAELGPGAVLGERATIEDGCRTSTVTARTTCRVAVTDPAALEADVRRTLAGEHRREGA